MHLSNRKGPAPQDPFLLLQKRWKTESKNAAAFAQSFKNPRGWNLPWFQGTGQLHPFLTMNFLCLSPQNREVSPLLGLDFFPGK